MPSRDSIPLTAMPAETDIRYFCAVYKYAGKVDLSKGYWDTKRKLGVTTHFSEINKLSFETKMRYIALYFSAF